MATILEWLPRIAGALVLVFAAMGISRWQRVGLERDMFVAILRAFVQLVAIGYALDLIFNSQGVFWVLMVIAIMVTIAGFTAGRRGGNVPRSKIVATVSVGIGTAGSSTPSCCRPIKSTPFTWGQENTGPRTTSQSGEG